MSFVKIAIHAVWGTKNRTPYLCDTVLEKVLLHMKANAETKEIYIDTIGGHTDHIHCLLYLNADMTLAKALQLIKGESAYWINKEKLTSNKFEWADEYFAASVSESMLGKVRNYISNQAEHHKKITFTQEYNKFILQYGFSQG